jgi:AcrR family transcriptional regulator/transcriptional regulator with XRE-family HTH domain
VSADRSLLGERIKRARLRRGLSQRELAASLGVSPATMSAVENGRTGVPPIRLARIAELVDVAVDDLSPGAGGPVRPAVGAGGRGRVREGPGGGVGVSADAVAEDFDWRRFPPLELDAPLRAGLSAFLEFGYHGATTREIAARAGLSVPGVYHYYPTKQDILVKILDLTMSDLAVRSAAARREGTNAVERFALLVECLALYHTHRRDLGFVGASEMRSLVPHERTRVADARRAQQRMVDEEVEEACRRGWFGVKHSREASRAVVTMNTALPQWFDDKGPRTAEEVALQYVDFALDLMRCDPRMRPSR